MHPHNICQIPNSRFISFSNKSSIPDLDGRGLATEAALTDADEGFGASSDAVAGSIAVGIFAEDHGLDADDNLENDGGGGLPAGAASPSCQVPRSERHTMSYSLAGT